MLNGPRYGCYGQRRWRYSVCNRSARGHFVVGGKKFNYAALGGKKQDMRGSLVGKKRKMRGSQIASYKPHNVCSVRT